MQRPFKVGDKVIARHHLADMNHGGFKNSLKPGIIKRKISSELLDPAAGAFFHVVDDAGQVMTFNESELILDEDVSKLLYL